MKAIEQTISPKIASTSESWLPIPKGSGKTAGHDIVVGPFLYTVRHE